jgi:hypothetical protein
MKFVNVTSNGFITRRGSSRKNLGGGGAGPHDERGARAYNGGLGAVPPVGSRGKAPGRGQGAKCVM